MNKLSPSTRKPIIFLYGPSGSGKSTVGRHLADNLNLPFIDLDLAIEASSGLTIPHIFETEGEDGFRARESQALQEAIAAGDQVIALGGGALTVAANRTLAESNGRVILLSAAPETLIERVNRDSIDRPLASGEAGARFRALLTKRNEHYASFPDRIDTSNKSPQDTAWDIQVRLGTFHIKGMSSTKHPGYDVRVAAGSLDSIGELLIARGLRGPVAVVTDENVAPFYLEHVLASLAGAGYPANGITIPAGEVHKTLETVSNIWEGFSQTGIERGSTVIALGGGVVGDLTGFAAATWLRGVPWVGVPTSLLAMVDASLGGKTGADLPQGKNLIGAFHPPRLVLADPDVLASLPEVEMVNGMAEAIKHGIIDDPELLELCLPPSKITDLASLVRRAMAVKVRVIEVDPYEKGLRMSLNLGHTVGHGVELASGFRLKHGEAVAIGTVAEARMAERADLAVHGLADKIAAVFQSVGLPTEIPPDLDMARVREIMMRDKKKTSGVLRFALPVAVGQVKVGVVIDDWQIE